ncbi:MAG: DUF4105 domain-containing protein [Saprospiraceae bacterium]|nr:DUF4105 domain-containing protein [Saprospiraceae bacterium]
MRIITLVFFICLHLLSFGQDTLRKDLKVSLLTIGPGREELYSIFGHSAIRIFNPVDQTDLSYNYGTFDFNTPNFYPKFLRGKLPYVLSVAPTSAFLQEYVYTKRNVSEQEINLSDDEKIKLINALNENAKPENRAYMYDFFLDNCATRIRDMFLNVAGEGAKLPEATPVTRRQMLHEYLPNFPWSEFGINLIIGSRADKEIGIMDQMFLPDYMQQYLGEVVVDSAYLFEPSKELLFFEEVEATQNSIMTSPMMVFTILGFVILLLTFLTKKPYGFISANIVFALLGIASIVVLFMWFGTDHKATKDNYNVIWLSPLFMIVPFAGIRISRILLIIIVAAGLICLSGIVPQDMPVLTLLPLIVCAAAAYIIGYPSDEEE